MAVTIGCHVSRSIASSLELRGKEGPRHGSARLTAEARAAAMGLVQELGLSAELSRFNMERETGLEPATLCLGSRGLAAGPDTP